MAITGAKFCGYYQLTKGFYELADIPTILQEKYDRTLEYCTLIWLEDIIVVTRVQRQEHEKKLFDILNKLENAGYRASKRKSEFFMKRTNWLGHKIHENRIKPNEEKVEAILKLNSPIFTLECTGKPYLLKAQHSAFNISDSTTKALTVQNWQITSFVPDSTDLVVDSSNKCLAVRTVGMQRCPGFHKNVNFAK